MAQAYYLLTTGKCLECPKKDKGERPKDQEHYVRAPQLGLWSVGPKGTLSQSQRGQAGAGKDDGLRPVSSERKFADPHL